MNVLDFFNKVATVPSCSIGPTTMGSTTMGAMMGPPVIGIEVQAP